MQQVPSASPCKSPCSQSLTYHCHGTPLEPTSFASQKFANFAARHDFAHRTSSSYCPRSNGESEHAVCTAKDLRMSDCLEDVLACSSTPLSSGYTPSQLHDGCVPGSHIPSTSTTAQLEPQWPGIDQFLAAKVDSQQAQKSTHDDPTCDLSSDATPPRCCCMNH